MPSFAPMSRESRFAVATLSLGSSLHHRLEDKLVAASQAGFAAIELFTPDWEKYLELYLAEHGNLANIASNRAQAALALASLLTQLNLRVNCLQPIRDVEGIRDPAQRAAKFQQVKEYFPICNILKIDLILCCSTDNASSIGDVDRISQDLVELADMAKQWQEENGGKLIRIGFEGLSWGAHVNTWRQAWACVNFRPRSNLGLIVDAFNSLAREYADPYTPSGLQRSPSASSVYLKRHLADLRTTVPGNKIFLFQIADAGLPPAGTSLAIPPSPESGIPRLQQWSRNCRLFPLETSKGAYLPVTQYARAVLATGYTGDLSLEVFNASLHLPDADVPRQHAVRGFESLKRLSAALSPSEASLDSTTATPEPEKADIISTKSQIAYQSALPSAKVQRIPLAPLS